MSGRGILSQEFSWSEIMLRGDVCLQQTIHGFSEHQLDEATHEILKES